MDQECSKKELEGFQVFSAVFKTFCPIRLWTWYWTQPAKKTEERCNSNNFYLPLESSAKSGEEKTIT